ncbi:MAG: ZIP family metal transporter [Syntrophorhabdus sp.]|jgi:zinc and cadmium transporter|nr:ZIP family metal transporter [Syntrophorhabdus sp.]
MDKLILIIIFSFLGSVGSLTGAFLLLIFPDKVRLMLIPSLISYATGTLLASSLLGMIPKALVSASSSSILLTVLVGMISFFLLEKLVIWRHCHVENCEVHSTAGSLILLGDTFHNFVDGIVIAAAFLTSIPLGLTTSFAVIAHEVPQETGDFAILLDSGYSKNKAFMYNLFSSMATLPGSLIGYFCLKSAQAAIPYILAFSAASFIYIATADLIPHLHQKTDFWSGITQFLLLLCGVGTVLFFIICHP